VPDFVSILVPCHDAERWVGDAIECAVGQDWPATEVIVADDGSTDRTREVLASFGSAIRWIAAPHRGANATRNVLLAEARGEWVSFLDADDTIPPGKISRQMETALRTRADLVVSPFLNSGEVLGLPASTDWWVELAMGRMGITSSNLWRREVVAAAGGWDPGRRRLQDTCMVFRLLRAGARVAVCPEPAAVHRLVNPRSVYVQDIGESLRERGTLVVRVLALLASRGELTAEAQRVLVNEALRHARILWEVGPRESGRSIERALAAALPVAADRTGDAGRIWPLLYRWLGFDVAEHYDVLRRRVHPWR
jgi:glycosyltransferase involved in cell wall biosynthesis